MNVENILINKKESILEALRKLNTIRDVSRLILFVENDNKAVIGSLTDGDIRRSLAKNADLQITLSDICNKNFSFEYETMAFLDLKNYRKQNIKILPILDSENRLIRIIDLERTKSELPLECMIMAGGRGKRLSPLTDSIPKPMLLLGEKPIIEHNIDRLISFGIKKIYISVKYLADQIEEYFGDGSSKGVEIKYIKEDEPLGTAGALSLVDQFNTDHILLMNSDLFTSINFEDLYLDLIEQGADMAVASTEYKVDVPYAIFETSGEMITDFKEKPSFVYHSNAGIYILSKDLINKIPKAKFFDITELMDDLVKNGGKLIHTPIICFWIDIGCHLDYEKAKELFDHIRY